MATNYGKTDVFPRKAVRKVRALTDYPKWGSLIGQRDIKYFCLYMDEGNRIYYQKRLLVSKVQNTIYAHMSETKRLKQFNPNAINFAKIYNRYRMPPIETNRTNSDTRTGFKMGSDYLVKAYFTFGQRFVPTGYSHVIQTLDIPILFYLRPRNCGDRVKDGLFPTRSLFRYDRRILLPRSRYRVPSGSVYVLFCVQKTFFRLDLVEETTEIPFECKDPVMHRVVKLDDLYDEPVATPYIEDQNQEEAAATYIGYTFPSSPPSESAPQDSSDSPATANRVFNFLRPYSQEPQRSYSLEPEPQSFSEHSQPAFEQHHSQPAFEQSQQPAFEQQLSEQPAFEQSQQPAFEQQLSEQPAFEQSQPAFEQSQPAFEQQLSEHSQPAFEQQLSEHSQPAFEQSQPAFEQSQPAFEQSFSEHRQTTFEQQQQQQQQSAPPTYILIQNSLPAVRKTMIVRVNDKDFASTYRRLAEREMKNPREKFCFDPNWQQANATPLDLTVKTPLIDLTAVERVDREDELPIDLSAKVVEIDRGMDLDSIEMRPMDQSTTKILEELRTIVEDGV